jgi:REP element-mobilizing transposase RayT
MRRKRRVQGSEGYFHVYNRAARRLKLFADAANRTYFMWLVSRAAPKFGLIGVAWCLIANHYHLLLKGTVEAIGKMMQEVERVYATRFNKLTGFNGCLFQGRFGSSWLPDMEAVTYVSRYIHANALDEGVEPESYVWSSARVYLGEVPVPDWMDVSPVLDPIGGPAAYRAYLRATPPKKSREGRREQAQNAFVSYLEDRCACLLLGHEEALGQLSFKILVCIVAMKEFAIRPRVLAKHFGYASGASVSAAASRMLARLRENEPLKACLKEVLSFEPD